MRKGGRRDRDRQTDMKKLIVAFRNFAKAPKNTQLSSIYKICAQPGRTKLLYKRKFAFKYLLNSHQPDGMIAFPKRLSVLYILK